MTQALGISIAINLAKEWLKARSAKKAAEKADKLRQRAAEYDELCNDLNAQLEALRQMMRGGK